MYVYIYVYMYVYTLCNCLIKSHILNPLSPSNIHIQILHTEVFTFP